MSIMCDRCGSVVGFKKLGEKSYCDKCFKELIKDRVLGGKDLLDESEIEVKKKDKKNENISIVVARNYAKKQVNLLKHFITYLIVNAVLSIFNNLAFPGKQWWLWIALLWGIALIIHLVVFELKWKLLQLEKRIMRKEMQKQGVDIVENHSSNGNISDHLEDAVEAEPIDKISIEESAEADKKVNDINDLKNESTLKEKLILANALRKIAIRRIVFGLLWFFGGLIVSLIGAIGSGPGERYYIFWGAVVVGIILLVKGTSDNSKANKLLE